MVLDTTPSKRAGGVLQNKLAVTCFMAIELKARLVLDQRLEKRLALEKLKARDIPTAKVQEIESVIDEAHAAFAIGRRLRLREAGQTGLVDTAEFAVDKAVFTLTLASAVMALGYLLVQSRPVRVSS